MDPEGLLYKMAIIALYSSGIALARGIASLLDDLLDWLWKGDDDYKNRF
jgi:hypothetical protein